MSGRALRASLLAALLAGLIVVPVALASGAQSTHGPGAAAGDPGSGLGFGRGFGGARPGAVPASFAVTCGFAREAMDDPIVYPGQPGVSHDHSFVGNLTTSASSTNASLLAGRTTCDDSADRSAYWMPTLLVAGKAVLPAFAQATYRRSVAGTVKPFPAGFRMIGGDSHATGVQPVSVVAWSCGSEAAGATPSQTPPTCPDAWPNGLRLRVTFPSCWDGSSLDSVNHKSHVAYPVAGACPSTHPVAVPELTLVFAYPSTGGSGVTLASGGALTGHADFMNAWQPGSLGREVARWFNGRQGQGGSFGQSRRDGSGTFPGFGGRGDLGGSRSFGSPAGAPGRAPAAPPRTSVF
jgi:hypothetical protein